MRVFGTRRRRCWTCSSGRASGGGTGAAARPSVAVQRRPETCEYLTACDLFTKNFRVLGTHSYTYEAYILAITYGFDMGNHFNKVHLIW